MKEKRRGEGKEWGGEERGEKWREKRVGLRASLSLLLSHPSTL